MSYSYTPQSLVKLPLLNAPSTVVITTELLVAAADQEKQLEAAGQALPTPIARARSRLEIACAALEAVLKPYLPSTDPMASKEADQALDRAWSGLNDLLEGWAKLPAPFNPAAGGVADLRALLFADGLGFVQLDYKSQWQASQARLQALASEPHLETLGRIGGLPFAAHLRQAHEQYGQVLGVTAVKIEEAAPAVAEKRQALHVALRDYVAKVAAWADPEEPGSETLVKALLAPLEAWESQSTKSSAPAASSSSSAPAGSSAPPA